MTGEANDQAQQAEANDQAQQAQANPSEAPPAPPKFEPDLEMIVEEQRHGVIGGPFIVGPGIVRRPVTPPEEEKTPGSAPSE